MEVSIDLENGLIVEVVFEGYYKPGQTSGPPEHCYPDEGECQWQINRAYFDCCDSELKFALTGGQEAEIIEHFNEYISDVVWRLIVDNSQNDYRRYDA